MIRYFLTAFALIALIGCSTSDDTPTNSPEDPDPNSGGEATIITANVTTIQNIGANGVTATFSISEEGSEPGVTDAGIVWSKNPNPSLTDNVISFNSTGTYTSQLAFLENATTYYTRSFGTNIGGTVYSAQESFTTLPESEALIFNGDIILTTQQEVIDFGYQNYSEVTGTLAINGDPMLTSLVPLQTILRMNHLDIVDCQALVNLSGLENLGQLDGNLQIFANPALTTTSGLSGLSAVGGFLSVYINDTLNNISSFSGITTVGGFLSISRNELLPSLNGLQGIESVGYYLGILRNPSLTDISALNNLQFVEDEFVITLNDTLEIIDGFNQLTAAGDDLVIESNASLVQISGFNNLSDINRELIIATNPMLQTINGFANVNNVGNIFQIRANVSLTNINGFNSLETVGSFFDISSNTQLSSIDAFNSLQATVGDLYIAYNNSLPNLDAFTNLLNTGDCTVINNETLSDLCGLYNLAVNNGIQYFYTVQGNAYNPTRQDIINGNCSL